MRFQTLFRSMLAACVVVSAAWPALANPILVFDPNSGQILQQDDAFRRWYPASLTKLMTAYVVFTALKEGELTLRSPIKVSKNALRQAPSKMGYPVGSVMNADNAITMMLVKSANDIAMALAENISGSEQAFVDRMNVQAARLGMIDTHYVNPNGLPEEGQYTSARDLAVLVSALRRDFPDRMHYFTIEGIVDGKRTFNNFNQMIGRYPGADGMKTGYICDSGFNVVGAATRNGRTLVAVVLGDKSVTARFDTAAALLDRGFAGSTQAIATLAGLTRPNDLPLAPTSVRKMVCPKPVKPSPAAKRTEKGKSATATTATSAVAAQDSGEAVPAGTKSRWVLPFDHAPTYVQVGLGGADGPAPVGMLDAEGNEFADVPLPIWRPDMADPTALAGQVAAEPQQGDAVPAGALRP